MTMAPGTTAAPDLRRRREEIRRQPGGLRGAVYLVGAVCFGMLGTAFLYAWFGTDQFDITVAYLLILEFAGMSVTAINIVDVARVDRAERKLATALIRRVTDPHRRTLASFVRPVALISSSIGAVLTAGCCIWGATLADGATRWAFVTGAASVATLTAGTAATMRTVLHGPTLAIDDESLLADRALRAKQLSKMLGTLPILLPMFAIMAVNQLAGHLVAGLALSLVIFGNAAVFFISAARNGAVRR